jgi:hypothetical protein
MTSPLSKAAFVSALVCVSVAVAPSQAVATPRDRTSEHVAVRAYQRYLSAILAALPVARQHEETFADSLATACPNVLAPLNAMPVSASNKATLMAFGEELGFDVFVASYPAFQPPLATLARALRGLRWSSHKTAVKIERALAHTRRVLAQAPSELCSDAQTVASSNGEKTPAATLNFIANTEAVDKEEGLGVDLSVFHAFERFGTRSDTSVYLNVGHLLLQLAAAGTAQALSTTQKAATALGLT